MTSLERPNPFRDLVTQRLDHRFVLKESRHPPVALTVSFLQLDESFVLFVKSGVDGCHKERHDVLRLANLLEPCDGGSKRARRHSQRDYIGGSVSFGVRRLIAAFVQLATEQLDLTDSYLTRIKAASSRDTLFCDSYSACDAFLLLR